MNSKTMQPPRTLFDKIWDAHVIQRIDDGPTQLYIDRLYLHEVTSPQAFDTLREKGIDVLRPQQAFAMPDHNTPSKLAAPDSYDATPAFERGVGPGSVAQIDTLRRNCAETGITLFDMGLEDNGIVHVVGPEKGLSLPGMTIVCGDSHTSTHGAVGAIALGIGTSEVAQVLASQCILQQKPKTMRINIEGRLAPCVTAKDVALYIIAQLTTSGATGYAVEYAGSTIRAMSMEGRLTLSNLTIEMGSRTGLIAPDDITFAYLRDRQYAPKGEAWTRAVASWRQLYSDAEAHFDREVTFRAEDIAPRITFGTNPGAGIAIDGTIPTTDELPESDRRQLLAQLDYMQFHPGQRLLGTPVDYVFLGACTNGRIEDFRAFASLVRGRRKAEGVTAWLVPGSWAVRRQIIAEGIDSVLADAGFELRLPSCSACLAMNADKVPAGKLCVSTSNLNFVGRQGPGSRTILASPLTAAAAAVTGVVSDPRELLAQRPSQDESLATGVVHGNKALRQILSTCIPIAIDNCNTDLIIPARYLASTTRDPHFFGDAFMHDLRYDGDGRPLPDFVLNKSPFCEPPSEGRNQIIVAGQNWGSGSSREHAAWAIAGYGIRAVVSSSIADIHRGNLLNCFVLPVIVSEAFRQELTDTIMADPQTQVLIDLDTQTVTNIANGHSESFDINGYKKYCLQHGLDDIDFLLESLKTHTLHQEA